MNRIRRGALVALMAATALLIAAPLAAAHPGHDHDAATQKVAINFAALNGSKPVTCTKPITGLGTTSRTARLTDLRFYVSGVQLLRKGGGAATVELASGSKWSYAKGNEAVTLIDLENGKGSCAAEGTKGMNAYVRGTVPKGTYTGVRYSVSVPGSLNHTDITSTPSPLNLAAMAWSWQFGRKFMKIEVSEDGGGAWASKIFYVHLGSTGCKGDPAAGEKAKCSLPNQDKVTLKKFNPAKQRIAIDFKTLFGGVDVASNGGMGAMGSMEGMEGMGGTPGCMSETTDPDCGPIFKALGLKLGTTKKTTQTAFRVVGR